MDATEKRKNDPSGHENHNGVTCSRCGWPYPNPHPSAKHRRAHKKICGKVQGFKVIDSDGDLAVSDDEDERQIPVVEVPEIDKRRSSGFGKGSNSRSEDDLFSDAATEFSDSAFSPGDSGKNIKKTAEGDLDSSPSSNADANAGSPELLSRSIESNNVKNLELAGNPGVSVAEDNSRDTKIIEEHVADEIRANVPENPIRNLNESFEAEIKALDPDGSISTTFAEDVGSDLDTSSTPSAGESISQREEKPGQGIDVRNHGDLKALDSTHTEWEKAFYNRSVAEDIPVIGNLDTLIEDFKDHCTVTPNLPLTLGSDEVIRPLADGGKSIVDEISYDAVMHARKDSVDCAQIETDVAQDTDAVGKGDLVEDSNKKSEGAKAVYDPSVAKDLPVGDDDRDVVDETSSSANINGVEASVNSVQVKADVPVGHGDLVEGSQTNSEGDKALTVLLFPRDLPLGDGDKDLDEISSDTNMNVVEDSINSAQIVANAEQNTDVGHGDSVKNSDTKIEVDEVVSVANDLTVAEHHDEDIKDHRILKSEIPLIPGVDGVIKPQVDGDKMVADDTISVDKIISDDSSSAATNPMLSQSTTLPGGDSEQEKMIDEFSDMHSNESTEAVVAGNCTKNTIENHAPLGMTSVEIVPGSTDVDIGGSNSRLMCKNNPGLDNCPDVDSQEVVKETKINDDIEVAEFTSTDVAGSESIYRVGEVSESILEEPILKKPGLRELPNVSEQPILSSSSVEHRHNRDSEQGAYPGTNSEPMLEKVDDKLNKNVGADTSAASSSRNSLEGNWGSVSVLSTQSDAQVSVDAETLLSSDSQAPAKLDKDNFVKSATASDEQQLDQSDVFEPPSFMTLVEQCSGVDRNAASSDEILAVQNSQQLKPESPTNVSESERKKNEEVIAKVTNWSTGKHESTPLKSLLGEAYAESELKSPNSMRPSTVAQKDEAAAGKNTVSTTTVKSVLSTEVPADQSAKIEAVPTSYPTDNRKGRKKMKGRTSWVPFVCCSSVNVN